MNNAPWQQVILLFSLYLLKHNAMAADTQNKLARLNLNK